MFLFISVYQDLLAVPGYLFLLSLSESEFMDFFVWFVNFFMDLILQFIF